jgi:methionyl-tRNA formyltransferase
MTSSNDEGLEYWISGKNPDVIVVFSMSQLLKPNIFSIPKEGTINLHAAYLPEYRGPNPDFWQYYYMEMEPGVTVHYVDAGEDTGDIILQERVEVPLGIKSPDRLDLLVGKVGVRLIIEALEQIASGSVERKQQPKKSPTQRARNIKKEEHAFIIDWQSWRLERIWHVMRGTELWLDCVSAPTGLLTGQRWQVGDFEKIQVERDQDDLGKVKRDKEGYYVICREGVIRLNVHFSAKTLIKKYVRRLVAA